MQSDSEEGLLHSCFGSLKNAVMGCCYGICQKETNPQDNAINERTHLLEVAEQQQETPSVNTCASTPPRKPDEQSALSRILHETATNVIDVGALGPYSLEASAYSERVRTYTTRAAGAALPPAPRVRLLTDLPPAIRRSMLAAPALSAADKELITNAVKKAAAAISELHVEHHEDLVVPFRVPYLNYLAGSRLYMGLSTSPCQDVVNVERLFYIFSYIYSIKMSLFDGEMELKSVYMADYDKKNKPKSPRRKMADDGCLIIGLSRDALKVRDTGRGCYDVLCPADLEYYKTAVQRFSEDHPKVTNMHMSKDIDPTPVDNEIQDLKRTEYLNKYCSRDLPFMSVNLARRAKALQTLHLPDDTFVPNTSNLASYRSPPPDKYKEPPSVWSMKPKLDPSLQKELRRILRVNTGESTYMISHGLLGKVVLDKNPYGPPREEPTYGRWRNPHQYTYWV
ncbi:uncharacterized protein LOC121726078 [Aricia agestis]|uniref:uncharacterized protein LOC121726078 n=1 Tax=Aricia agestis TaxID=91739 RepID=UPI001C2037C8|nr:uncharacterized protein LOC121726078 [Aricia agestis]